jgi:hypothetical protein
MKMTQTKTSILKMIAYIGLLSGFAACSEIKYVKDSKLNAYTQNGQVYAEIATTLDIGNITIPPATIPIPNPNRPGTDVGQLYIQSTPLGPVVGVRVSLSDIANIPSSTTDSNLPNGAAIPISGFSNSNLVSFKLNGGHKVYVYIDVTNKTAMLGTAIVIPGFTPPAIGMNAALFVPFSFPTVKGFAGLFLGQTSGTSGLGIFADASDLFKSVDFATQARNGRGENQPGPVWSFNIPAIDSSAKIAIETTVIQADQNRAVWNIPQ